MKSLFSMQFHFGEANDAIEFCKGLDRKGWIYEVDGITEGDTPEIQPGARTVVISLPINEDDFDDNVVENLVLNIAEILHIEEDPDSDVQTQNCSICGAPFMIWGQCVNCDRR